MTSLHHNRVDSSSSSSSRGIYSAFIGGPEACTRHSVSPYICVCVCVCDSATVVAQAATGPLLSLFTHTHTQLLPSLLHRVPNATHNLISWIRCRPGGCETICPPPRRWQFDGGKNRGGSTSVRGRIRSPHISGGRRWLSCRYRTFIILFSLGSCAMGQTDGRTERRTDRAIPKCPPRTGAW